MEEEKKVWSGTILSPRINEAVRGGRLNYLTGPPLVTCLLVKLAPQIRGSYALWDNGYFYHHGITPDLLRQHAEVCLYYGVLLYML